jgi:hypothetical protein
VSSEVVASIYHYHKPESFLVALTSNYSKARRL